MLKPLTVPAWARLLNFRSLDRGSRASDHLDLLRGVAAVAVLLGHLHNAFFAPFHKSGSRNPFFAGLILLSSFSHEAVIIFFVLSGYLIGTSVLKGVVTQRWSWSSYIARRATRLYVVLLPALLLTAFLDRLGLRLFGALGNIYAVRKPGFAWAFTSPEVTRLGTDVFLGNLFYLQSIVVPSYGSNMALWSLSLEWWYYILLPVAVLTGKWGRSIGIILTAIATYLAGFMLIGYFGIWLMGIALNTKLFVSMRWITRGRALAIFIANLVLIRVFKMVVYHDDVPGISQGCLDFEVGVVSLILIETMLRDARVSRRNAYNAVARNLSGMSYTLYAVHSPIVVFCCAMLLGSGELWRPGVLAFSKAGAVALFTIAVAYLFARLFEDRTDIIREGVTRLVARRFSSKSGLEPQALR